MSLVVWILIGVAVLLVLFLVVGYNRARSVAQPGRGRVVADRRPAADAATT